MTIRLKLNPDDLPTGANVGSVEIVDCVRNSRSKRAIRGQWHWILKNPRYLLLNGKHFLAQHKDHK